MVEPEIKLKDIVARIVDLPTLPNVVCRLLSAVEDPRSNAREVNQIMSHDPSLAARILKLVNSSFYGLPRPVNSVQQAVVILGYNTVRSLALSASVFDAFSSTTFKHEAFWIQSLTCALMCENLAARSDRLRIDTGFTAGLLHGIGKIILEQYAPTMFEVILQEARRKQLSFAETEQLLKYPGYCEIGFWLAEKWKLPTSTQNAIRFQDAPLECPEDHRPLAAALQLSRLTCRELGCNDGGDYDQPGPIPELLWEILEVEEREMVQAELSAQLARATDLFTQIKS